MTLRLTLRTLLSYLDDTLEPNQAKTIGAKVAESEQARELMERIKQVTRRRRLTTPPTSGPGGIDPNTIAEYLDNEVTPEKAAEVEQICLASDVHLAEVAACHQILTLVLGEPALVPPSAKQRMYGLIKGPESIPFRKPSKNAANADQDLSSEIELDHDEVLRLGAPPVGSTTRGRNFWLMIGGGVLAASLLFVAVWQLVHVPPPPDVQTKGGDLIAKSGEAKDKPEPAKDEANKKPSEVKIPQEQPRVVPKKTDDDKPATDIKVEPAKLPDETMPTEIARRPASDKQVALGRYLQLNAKEPSILLTKSDKGGWTRLLGKNVEVPSARPLMSLSGSKSVIILETGVELTLWGNMFEMTLDPFFLESRVILHAPTEPLDADLTLQRGRLILRNKRPDRDTQVRVRFHNPTLEQEEYCDITLNGGEAAVVLERFSDMDQDEPFYENPLDKMRKGPTAHLGMYAYDKSANVRSGGLTFTLEESQEPILQWQSRRGALGPPNQRFIPAWLKYKGTPPLPEGFPKQFRTNALKAYDDLARVLEKKPVDVALAEILQSVQKAAQNEIFKDNRMSDYTIAQWTNAIRCQTAIDNITYLYDQFSSSENTPLFIRGLCMQSLKQWLALDRENDYELLKVVRKNSLGKIESVKIMELFHFISVEDTRKPSTYQILIEGLNNEALPIRILSHTHLLIYVPAGRMIPYDPTSPRPAREAAVRAWEKLIPRGQMPPAEMPPKKKGKS